MILVILLLKKILIEGNFSLLDILLIFPNIHNNILKVFISILSYVY